LLEEEVAPAFWELLTNEFIEFQDSFETEVIPEWTVLWQFLVCEMMFVVNFPDHA
jgi:hypothetical protein